MISRDILVNCMELRWRQPCSDSVAPCLCKVERVVVKDPLSRVGHTHTHTPLPRKNWTVHLKQGTPFFQGTWIYMTPTIYSKIFQGVSTSCTACAHPKNRTELDGANIVQKTPLRPSRARHGLWKKKLCAPATRPGWSTWWSTPQPVSVSSKIGEMI